ncbi:hypothetical protein BHE74_00037064 [Ensete ventricosum]|nr:hypothetical protein BHE74_00037064 [Ensete ventricosum]
MSCVQMRQHSSSVLRRRCDGRMAPLLYLRVVFSSLGWRSAPPLPCNQNLYKGCHKRLAVVACSRDRTRGGRMRVKAASSDGHVRVEAAQAATARWQPSRPSNRRAGRGRTGVVALAATTMSAE